MPTDEVHVWRLGLDLAPAQRERLRGLLSAEEQERAARFHFEEDRDHYTAARGFLRLTLSRYLHCDPSQICFSYNKFGRPELAEPVQVLLRFNVAHSHGMGLFAFTLGRQIGVDVELICADRATDDIAQRFFAPAEAAALQALPPEVRVRAFFDCWTRKEAFIKARGVGLSLGLDKFTVSLAPGEPAALLHANDDPYAPSRWTLWNLDAADGYSGALAVEGLAAKLKCWTDPGLESRPAT